MKRDGYFGKPIKFAAFKPDTSIFWAYAMAYRFSGDPFFLQMTHNIGRGYDVGALVSTKKTQASLNLDTTCAEPRILLGILELHRKNNEPIYLELAGKIGDNIIREKYRRGFFVQSRNNSNSRFDALEPLALLYLACVIDGKQDLVPIIRPSTSSFHYRFDGIGRIHDQKTIFAR